MNTKQTVENFACISTVNREGQAWFWIVGQIYPWEIAQREQNSSSLVQLTTHTAPLGISPEQPPPSAMDAHQHGSPRTMPSGAQEQTTTLSSLCSITPGVIQHFCISKQQPRKWQQYSVQNKKKPKTESSHQISSSLFHNHLCIATVISKRNTILFK